MLFFGHIGITIGAASVVSQGLSRHKSGEIKKASWFEPLARYMDIRLLIVGSMLPDIVDKPIGQYFFVDTFYNGRIFGHTLLFLIILATAGYLVYKRYRHLWLLTLAAGSFMHIALDEMWQVPGTLFWPLMGFHFPQVELTGWFANLFRAIISSPYIYVSEIIGLAVAAWFAAGLISRKKVQAFLIHGKTD
jgi:inner membrane protein